MARPTARETALRALRAIEERQAYAGQALDQALAGADLEPRDRALATELVYGVSRRMGALDWFLGHVSVKPLPTLDPLVRCVLRMAAYQLLHLDRIPPRAVVHEAVALARRYGHEGVARFVNGVLRGLLRRLPTIAYPDADQDPVGHLSLTHAHPAWLVARWLELYGRDETAALLAVSNAVPPLTVRVNALKATPTRAIAALQADGVAAVPAQLAPCGLVLAGIPVEGSLASLAAHAAGWITAQDESSMLVAPVVDPQPGQTVLDLAAAPGSKATHLAERMGNHGRVLALDIHPQRLGLIRQNCRRLGASCVEAVELDARQAGTMYAGQADAALVDAPCSGLGTLARRPDARWRKEPRDIPVLAALQQELLAAAAAALKPGGVLVYSTCTIEPRENQEVVRGFLARHPDFNRDDVAPYLPPPLQGDVQEGAVQLLPHRHGTDGFFIARLRRK